MPSGMTFPYSDGRKTKSGHDHPMPHMLVFTVQDIDVFEETPLKVKRKVQTRESGPRGPMTGSGT